MTGTFVGMPAFPTAARAALGRHPAARATWRTPPATIRAKRAAVVAEVARLGGAAAGRRRRSRTDAAARPRHAPARSSRSRSTARGAIVHWARDAAEACAIVADGRHAPTASTRSSRSSRWPPRRSGSTRRSRREGIAAWETDLAELIVQLGDDLPSPHPGAGDPPQPRRDPRDLPAPRWAASAGPRPTTSPTSRPSSPRPPGCTCARSSCAPRSASPAPTSPSPTTGTLVVVESEGNGRMCLTLPEVLVSVVGIEKVVPTWADLDVFLQLLPRSSTGERMNPYTSTWTGVTPGDGPQEVHVVLLDNGRTRALADEVGRQALRCIRCSACLNVCPVYERTGGHAYGSVYPGPIGAILNPLLTRRRQRRADRLAAVRLRRCAAPASRSARCASTSPTVLVDLRAQVVDAHRGGRPKPRGGGDEGARRGRSPTLAASAASRRASGLVGGVLGRVGRARRCPAAAPASGGCPDRVRPGPAPATCRPRRAESFRAWWQRTSAAGRRARREPPATRSWRRTSGAAPRPTSTAAAVDVPRGYRGRATPPTTSSGCSSSGSRTTGRSSRGAPRPTWPSGSRAALPDGRAGRRTAGAAVVDVAGAVVDDGLSAQRARRLRRRRHRGRGRRSRRPARSCSTTGPDQGRRALSLVPDLHVCVVRADQVVADVPEAVAAARPGPAADLDQRPVGDQRHRARPGRGRARPAHPARDRRWLTDSCRPGTRDNPLATTP